MSETVVRPSRVRGVWGDAGPPLTPYEQIEAEILEAFQPVQEWQFAAPVERSTSLYLEAVAALTTLSAWGWSITVTRAQTRWTVSAARAIGTATVKGKVVAESLIEALRKLETQLTASLADLLDPPKKQGGRPRKQEVAA